MTLGEKISVQRKKRGFSQEGLAEKCGTSLRTIQRIETNQSQPRPYTLKVIADCLQMSIEELEGTVESISAASDVPLSKINLINSSALLVLLFPFLNLIAPLILWNLNKKNSVVNEKGKMIISFQVLWSLLSIFILSIVHYLQFKITGAFVSEGVSFEFITYVILLAANAFFIFTNSVQLKKGNVNIYPSFPQMF